ncbi:MAG: PilZ domain-containing protein [Candidatus Omnitrophica bacterium]|nr:PilZ domain-containing protein [Candidatus Omnitrophota bacterium]MBU4488882.1 PilZ domain-containing protein [Candidatus Omnitrophota bacterium]MCG2705470.1 PilZ domain-containing protein [Candidatus Omnitrophota bacterium]
MLLSIQLIIIIVLILSLAALFIEEMGSRKAGVPKGIVREYWDGKERRKAMRVNTELAVRYSIEKKLHLKLNGAIKDISQKGVRLVVTEKLTEGTLLLLEFSIPDKKGPIIADGKVVWTSGAFDERDVDGKRIFETGVQFVNIEPDGSARLVSYIEKIST